MKKILVLTLLFLISFACTHNKVPVQHNDIKSVASTLPTVDKITCIQLSDTIEINKIRRKHGEPSYFKMCKDSGSGITTLYYIEIINDVLVERQDVSF